jgi:hypothetical protein
MMRGKPHCVTAVPSFLGVPRTFRGLAWCARFAAKLTLPGCHPSSLRGVLPELLPGSSRNYSRISLVVKRRWSGRWFEKRSRLLFRCIGHVLNDTFSIGWLGCGGHDARQRLEGVPSEWAPVMDPLIHHVFVLWSVIDRRAKDRPRPRAVPTSILVQGKCTCCKTESLWASARPPASSVLTTRSCVHRCHGLPQGMYLLRLAIPRGPRTHG